jgi:hypothetical protein
VQLVSRKTRGCSTELYQDLPPGPVGKNRHTECPSGYTQMFAASAVRRDLTPRASALHCSTRHMINHTSAAGVN